MKIKSLFIGTILLSLVGCTSNYSFYPDKKANSNYEDINVQNQSITIKGQSSTLTIKSLEENVGPWTAPRMQFTMTNDSPERIMIVKASDLRLGFSGFWFDVVDYKIVQEGRADELSFHNNENFKYEHEILPNETITIDATFETPKSQENYIDKHVLIESYTNLDVFNAIYKIKKTRK